jgi:hypothetical protein
MDAGGGDTTNADPSPLLESESKGDEAKNDDNDYGSLFDGDDTDEEDYSWVYERRVGPGIWHRESEDNPHAKSAGNSAVLKAVENFSEMEDQRADSELVRTSSLNRGQSSGCEFVNVLYIEGYQYGVGAD